MQMKEKTEDYLTYQFSYLREIKIFVKNEILYSI